MQKRYHSPGGRHQGPQQIENKPSLPGVKKIIAVASGKGGVGKSTTAVNLAIALSKHDKKIALLDADIYGPSIPMLMNLSGQRPQLTDDKKLVPLSNYGIKCMSMGFMIEEDSPMIWRGPMVMSALEQMFRQTQWGDVDIMVIDLPPGTGDAQLSICQRVPVAGAVIVCTPQDLALLDAVRGTNMFRKVDVPIFGIVENMSHFICPHCNGESHIFGKEGARNTATKMNIPFLGEVPLHPRIRELSDQGKPITIAEPNSPQSKAYQDIADKVASKLEDPELNKQQEGPKIVIE